jgi:hypothetical protein
VGEAFLHAQKLGQPDLSRLFRQIRQELETSLYAIWCPRWCQIHRKNTSTGRARKTICASAAVKIQAFASLFREKRGVSDASDILRRVASYHEEVAECYLDAQRLEVSVAPQVRAFVCDISGASFSSDGSAIGSQADVGIAASVSIGERRIWSLLGAFVFSRGRGAFSSRWPAGGTTKGCGNREKAV